MFGFYSTVTERLNASLIVCKLSAGAINLVSIDVMLLVWQARLAMATCTAHILKVRCQPAQLRRCSWTWMWVMSIIVGTYKIFTVVQQIDGIIAKHPICHQWHCEEITNGFYTLCVFCQILCSVLDVVLQFVNKWYAFACYILFSNETSVRIAFWRTL